MTIPLQAHLLPAQRYQLGHAQAMAVGEQDRGRIAVAMPAHAPGGLDQGVHLGRGQMFARPPVLPPTGRLDPGWDPLARVRELTPALRYPPVVPAGTRRHRR